ncbi:hypothetical protein LEP1GSC137_2274 [Leptospira borgpetersenii str. Noumea 25]|uniref:Uncharacterized protein n=1 Tax=Leptospira borgpetersenii serovar Ballum TaxID=280505 RepID=A0A0S2IU38_LEPBO|nr:hypothetical protein LBBP_02940 [Leptospira borgpetersenii serovar Ballum]ANH01573.1 Uncharacterized protein LB4E_2315 [Leptospira borgpetersenii str. 4E]EMO09433.1 hypothetical protein LEP1GSC137_2274 [Leptospira borgpetersenii str. Noumea 25]
MLRFISEPVLKPEENIPKQSDKFIKNAEISTETVALAGFSRRLKL